MWFYITVTCSCTEKQEPLEETSRIKSPQRCHFLFSLCMSRANPDTAPWLVAKPELQLKGHTTVSVHTQTSQVLLLQIRYQEKQSFSRMGLWAASQP